MSNSKSICVFCSSSDAIDKEYFTTARELGELMGRENYSLIYGGASIGLMGEVARSVHRFGGKVTGIIPEALTQYEIAYTESDELVVTKNMSERKVLMEKSSDAFIAMPGGFGTLEELLEILTLKQLQYHNKAVVILNTRNFFKNMIALFEQIYTEKFAKTMHRDSYFIATNAAEAVEYIKHYKPKETEKKWF